jgi:hypothetical protein
VAHDSGSAGSKKPRRGGASGSTGEVIAQLTASDWSTSFLEQLIESSREVNRSKPSRAGSAVNDE